MRSNSRGQPLYESSLRRLRQLAAESMPGLLHAGLKGLEKESLRVTPDGHIAQTSHPRALGSALTHPYITTDYSEALLEFITPPLHCIEDAMEYLGDIHTFVYGELGDELLWVTSMPCAVGSDDSIPIADYGSSNVGMMKHVYRRGLGYRYGRAMQTISGVHFNFSLSESLWPLLQAMDDDSRSLQAFKSEAYFRLIRNFQRFGWIVPYLFGASPALCKSFLQGHPHAFDEFDANTAYAPYATSLRMSDIGYKNKNQAGLNISYNSLDAYVAGLRHAIETPEPDYEAIGVEVDGEYRQLNANLLQIENEYYSFVRPKNVARRGEKPTSALRDRGVQYVEIRALDVSAFDPVGVNSAQLRFLEAFLIFCLLEDSPPITPDEQREIDANQREVAVRGRSPGLELVRAGRRIALRDWAQRICDALEPLCAYLDQGMSQAYTESLATQCAAIRDPEATPSARILAEMRERGESFFQFSQRMSAHHAAYFHQRRLDRSRLEEFRRLAQVSLAEQQALEQERAPRFETFLADYFARP